MIYATRWEVWEIETLRHALGNGFAGDKSKAIAEVARRICRTYKSVWMKALNMKLIEPEYYAGDRELEERGKARQRAVNATFLGR